MIFRHLILIIFFSAYGSTSALCSFSEIDQRPAQIKILQISQSGCTDVGQKIITHSDHLFNFFISHDDSDIIIQKYAHNTCRYAQPDLRLCSYHTHPAPPPHRCNAAQRAECRRNNSCEFECPAPQRPSRPPQRDD